MGSKKKGTRAERELIHMFFKSEPWASVRVAGSGSMPFPCPDLVAGNGKRVLAIECKSLADNIFQTTRISRFTRIFKEIWS